MTLASFIDRLTNTQSVEELWKLHCEKMQSFGFDKIFYGFTNYRLGRSLGDPEDFVILSNHETSYLDWFIGEAMYFHAPMVRWALKNEGVTSWAIVRSMLEAGELTDKEQDVVMRNQAEGFISGYTISFKSVSPRSKGAIALTGPRNVPQDVIDDIWRRHGAEIVAINNVAHLKILSLPHVKPTRELTKRQLEALHWVGDGKTTADVALLMGLTSATVEKHLRLARDVLSVETTAQAVLKSALQNQMFVVEY
ncbi:LuxR family transcriptional regulator [Lentibacter algarum]|uniref:helix-turn-helix transcriptional regulator n=1 Tax=Lentibacter algarum TaxID=576131 RepID=UPI001C06B0F9|nr:LuxR family transcriptional regulator [Lentibacter algarum]MBU2982362.1 LuxR family transcriptional regulator [Lentibacter algarum]